MKYARVVIAIAALTICKMLLSFRLNRPTPKPPLVIQGQTVSNWLSSVDIGAEVEGRMNPACEALLSAGDQVIPDLCEVLLATEPFQDIVLHLPDPLISVDKKYVRANESEILIPIQMSVSRRIPPYKN